MGREQWQGCMGRSLTTSLLIYLQESTNHLRIIGVLQASYRVTVTIKNPYYSLGHLRFFSASTKLFFFCYITSLFDKLKKKAKNKK